MAINKKLQMTIDFALKNAKKLEGLIAALREKYGINIDDSEVTKLAAEIESLSSEEVEITADSSQAVDGAEEATEAVESVPDEHETEITADAGNTLQVVSQISLVYQGLAQVYGQVKDAIGDLLDTYFIQEESDRKLLSALKNKTTAHAEYFKFLSEEADRIQQISLIGDEESQKLMATAINMGIELDKVADATKGAIGLSEKFADIGLSQETAMKGIALAYAGEFTQLSRYIPELRTAATDTDKMRILQENMSSGFDMASDAIDTQYGKVEQLRMKYGDLKEVAGGWIMKLLVMDAEALGIDLEQGKRIQETRKNFSYMANDIDAMSDAYREYSDNNIIAHKELEDALWQMDRSEQAVQQQRIRDTELAMQVLREMAEEYERNKKAAEDAATAAQAYDESVAHLAEPIAGLSDEIDAILGEDTESTLLDDLFWANDDLSEKTDATTDATVELLDKQLSIINDFNQKTKQLNGDHYAASMMQVDEYYRRKHDALIEAGFTEEEITEQTEAAKDEIRKRHDLKTLQDAANVVHQLANLSDMMLQNKLSDIEQEKQAEIDKVNNSVMSEEEKQAAIDKINKKYAKKERQAKEANKPVMIADAVSNTALGVTKALSSASPPFNFLLAALVAAQGALQVSTIKAQKFGKGGIADKPSIFGEAGPEAAVPLPDGKSIPVTLNGGGESKHDLSDIMNMLQIINTNLVNLQTVNIKINTVDRDIEVLVDDIDYARSNMQSRGYDGA